MYFCMMKNVRWYDAQHGSSNRNAFVLFYSFLLTTKYVYKKTTTTTTNNNKNENNTLHRRDYRNGNI